MSLSRPDPPQECAAAFSRSLPEFLALPTERRRAGEAYVGDRPAVPTVEDIAGPGRSAKVAPHNAQQVFRLGLRDVANNAGIGTATPAGWRVFAGGGPGKTMMGRVAPRALTWKLTAAYHGDRTWELLQLSSELDSLPQVGEAEYELRVLSVPGLHLEVFWLAAMTEGSEDLVLPISRLGIPAIDDAQLKDRAITMANFLGLIRPRALLALSLPDGAARWDLGT